MHSSAAATAAAVAAAEAGTRPATGRPPGRAPARRGRRAPRRPRWSRVGVLFCAPRVSCEPVCVCVSLVRVVIHLSSVHPYRVGVQSEPGCSSFTFLPNLT